MSQSVRATSSPTDSWVWLFPVAYGLHIAEEYAFHFPAYVANLSGRHISNPQFLVINAVFWLLMVATVVLVLARPSQAWLIATLAAVLGINDGSPYFVRIPGVRMGAFEVPHAGIRLNGSTYIAVNTGADINLPDPTINERSVLTRFDEAARRFTVLRTISSRPDGKFITTALRQSGNDVYIFGLSVYRASDIYLSVVAAADFESGRGTRYYTGLVNGQPAWSTSEADAVPVVLDNPLNMPNHTPGVGNFSVIYSNELRLWLMTYDSFRGSPETRGFYFTYASEPWGPWQRPQLIFNGVRDGAMGTFIHDPRISPSDGLTGPTIGPNDPVTTPGGPYAPHMIERFTRIAGRTLSIYYTLGTFNPYTIVMMRSDFLVSEGSSRRRSARH